MKEVIDIKTIMENLSTFDTKFSINRTLLTKIMHLSFQYQFKKFKTNVKILSVLEDTTPVNLFSTSTILNNSTTNIVLYGRLYHIDIYLDSNMTWNDDRIIPMYDESLMRSYKINRIKGKEVKLDLLEELKIENLDF